MTRTEAQIRMRDLTAQALREAAPGFDEFERRIEVCTVALEDGADREGREALARLVQPLHEFALFCRNVIANCGAGLPDAMRREFHTANQKLGQALAAIVEEAEDENPIGVSDACRLDLADALDAYQVLFPKMAAELEQRPPVANDSPAAPAGHRV